jgi:hypothetical protein
MFARLTFTGIIAFWLTMNLLLWRMEYGARGGDTPVPLKLVWHKILTAPDTSSLSVYQRGERMGFCELSTGVGQQMASYDEDKPPPEGFVARANYQFHAAGNVSLGDFTNRLKFDCRVLFDHSHNWTELNLKLSSRTTAMEIHALATNQTAHLKFSAEGIPVLERDLAAADLQSPTALVRALAGTLAGDFPGAFDPAEILPAAPAQGIQWEARRTRIKIGAEAVPVYQLETSVLGRSIIVDVSTLGEVLRVELPGNVTASIDDWNKP